MPQANMTPFSYGGQKRDEGLPFRRHLNNFMSDIIFYNNISWEITCFFGNGNNRFLSQHKRNGVIINMHI